MANIADAIRAYSNVAKNPVAEAAPIPGAGGSIPPGQGFSALLDEAAKVMIETGKTAEMKSSAAIAGKADIREVVAAVANAELTLETVVAVRDKVITAYNEIMRMPI